MIAAPWRKVLADLWRERTRSALVVIAMAVGLACFLGVMATYAILTREINRGYLATNPASAVISTTRIDDDLVAAAIARPDIDDAEERSVVTGRLRTSDGAWRRLVLFVIRDFTHLRINTISAEAGAWPPAAGDMLIERDAFQVARARIGDVVTVETKSGGSHQLRVAGRVHDAGQAQARMENLVYAYISRETLTAIGDPVTVEQLRFVAHGDRFDEKQVISVTTAVKSWLEKTGHAVQRVEIPPPGQHPHAVIMGFLLLLMATFGLFALGLSGLIVMNLMIAMLAAERRQIGVMKAIGARRRQISAVYLAEAALLGFTALCAAAPAGIVLARALSGYFAVLLNFDLATLAIPVWVYALVIAVALIVPLAAAAYPVAVATEVTVREALAADVNHNAFGTNRLDRLFVYLVRGGRLASLANLKVRTTFANLKVRTTFANLEVRTTFANLEARTARSGGAWAMGLRNTLRRRTRTLLSVVTLAIAGAFFISALTVRTSLMTTANRRFGAGTYGADFRYAFDQHMLMIYVFLLIVAGVLGLVGGLGLSTATSLNVLERRRELGILRAIGAAPLTVASIVVSEALFIAFAAWIFAVLTAWGIALAIGVLVPAASLFRDGLEVSLSIHGVVGWLAITIAISVLASIVPARSASRISIREAITYE